MVGYSLARLEGLALEANLAALVAGRGPPTTVRVRVGNQRYEERGQAWGNRVPAALAATRARARRVVAGLRRLGVRLRGVGCVAEAAGGNLRSESGF